MKHAPSLKVAAAEEEEDMVEAAVAEVVAAADMVIDHISARDAS